MRRFSKVSLTLLFCLLVSSTLIIIYRLPWRTAQKGFINENRKLVLTYEQAFSRVQSAYSQSIHRFDRNKSLPLMNLRQQELDLAYRVTQARTWLKSKNLVVASAVRDAMGGLRRSIHNLRKLASLFQSVTLVFVENDSKDDTRLYLHNLTKDNGSSSVRVQLLGCGTVNSDRPCRVPITYGSKRTHQPGHWEQAKRTLSEESVDRGLVMAALRNIYMQFVYDQLGDADLLLVIESDLSWNEWNLDSISQGLYYFKAKPQLDSLCAYTIFASLIHDPCTLIYFDTKRFYVDATEHQRPFIDRLGKANKHAKQYLQPEHKSSLVPNEPVKVQSCFQGFTFYRLSSLAKRQVFYKYSLGEWLCEHSTLSMQLTENYLDINMKLYFSSHNRG